MLTVRITRDRLGELSELMHENASKAVRATAFNIVLDAQSYAPVDTGAMKNSIYVVTDDESSYADASSDARVLNEIEILPEMDAPKDDLTAIVAVGAEYGLYVEMGTVRTSAQPYLEPAAELSREAFEQAMKGILGR